jgi:hypothetical protein
VLPPSTAPAVTQPQLLRGSSAAMPNASAAGAAPRPSAHTNHLRNRPGEVEAAGSGAALLQHALPAASLPAATGAAAAASDGGAGVLVPTTSGTPAAGWNLRQGRGNDTGALTSGVPRLTLLHDVPTVLRAGAATAAAAAALLTLDSCSPVDWDGGSGGLSTGVLRPPQCNHLRALSGPAAAPAAAEPGQATLGRTSNAGCRALGVAALHPMSGRLALPHTTRSPAQVQCHWHYRSLLACGAAFST